jgi:hypothetical protein
MHCWLLKAPNRRTDVPSSQYRVYIVLGDL